MIFAHYTAVHVLDERRRWSSCWLDWGATTEFTLWSLGSLPYPSHFFPFASHSFPSSFSIPFVSRLNLTGVSEYNLRKNPWNPVCAYVNFSASLAQKSALLCTKFHDTSFLISGQWMCHHIKCSVRHTSCMFQKVAGVGPMQWLRPLWLDLQWRWWLVVQD